MSSWYQPVDEAHVRRERARARELRASPWWKTKGNVVPACFACNQTKAAQTPAEQILESLGFSDDDYLDVYDAYEP